MPANSAAPATRRIYILTGILVLWLLGIGLRLVYLQIVRYGDLTQQARRQQQRSIEVAPKRGIIYDRNGHELAMSVQVDSIFAVPSEVPDPQNAARLLARVLKMDADDILARMKSSRAFCWVARKVDAESSERVRALNLKGIYFQKESKRFYPKRELAAQALGYVGVDDDGLGGLEREYNKDLRGRPGKMLISMDAKRRWFGRVERQPDSGRSLVLTIDEKVQYIAEREIDRAMQETRTEAATIIVQNPHTGEVLALANRPTFNPNVFDKVPAQSLKNRAVSDIYEPGSTFKIVTIAAALEEKLTRPEEMIDCQEGAIQIGGLRIRDHEKFGVLSVTDVVAHSSDVGAIKVGLRLGEERFDHYIRAFGFGSQSGIELPGETRGLTKPVSRWSKVSIGAISMGQEIGISAIQLAGMVSTIANEGLYTPARIVAGTTTSSGPLQNVSFHVPRQRRAISTLTALEMKKMLEAVVLHGTGRKALLDGYTSAGKTGTAQKTDPATGAYSKTKYVASFAGFAPVNNPALTVVVILDSAQGLHQGGQIAAPVWARVMQQTLAYLNVPHDAEVKNSPQRRMLLAQVKDEELAESSPDRLGGGPEIIDEEARPTPAVILPAKKPSPEVAATAKVLDAALKTKIGPAPAPPRPLSAPAGAPLPVSGTVVVDTEAGVVVPSLLGRGLRSALEIAQQAGIELDVIGNGIAREQMPPPGSRIPAGRHVAVRFSR
ncbi:MAG TPA: penicillin-binding transpeptidase domain-containing protein [Terriglobales bacterium]|nr:penicillin-binding transpeptidase domain-containing protein [Terriglobales bacterium]